LDPTKGSVLHWNVPQLLTDPTASQYRPAALRDAEWIRALAVTPTQTVVIAVAGASSLAVFDPATAQFSTIPLVTPGDANDVAVADDGTIGVAMENFATHHLDKVALFKGGVLAHIVSSGSGFITAAHDRFLAGAEQLSSISTDGQASVVRGSDAVGFSFGAKGALLGDGRAAGIIPRGVAFLDPATQQTSRAELPQYDCNPPGAARAGPPPSNLPAPAPGPGAPGALAPVPQSNSCSPGLSAFAVLPSGDVYVLDGTEPGHIGRLSAGSF
jgi:hypothetical protein